MTRYEKYQKYCVIMLFLVLTWSTVFIKNGSDAPLVINNTNNSRERNLRATKMNPSAFNRALDAL